MPAATTIDPHPWLQASLVSAAFEWIRPMPIVECPHCAKRFEAPKELAGLKAKCSKCGRKIPIVFSRSQEKKAPKPPTRTEDSLRRTNDPPDRNEDPPEQPDDATSDLSLTMLSAPDEDGEGGFPLFTVACALAAFVALFVIAFLAGKLRGAAERADAAATAMQTLKERAAVVEQDSFALDREIVTLTGKLREAQARAASAETKLGNALKAKEQAHAREVAALKDAQKLTHAATQQDKERDEILAAHIGRLSASDREMWRKLTQKAKDHTLSFDEYRELERLLGGDLAFLAAPNLREIRNESIRRLAKENPAQERLLRTLEPQAFANGGAGK